MVTMVAVMSLCLLIGNLQQILLYVREILLCALQVARLEVLPQLSENLCQHAARSGVVGIGRAARIRARKIL